jgi:hypothetical protein
VWTNDVLGAALRSYTRVVFQRDRQERHHSFGHEPHRRILVARTVTPMSELCRLMMPCIYIQDSYR